MVILIDTKIQNSNNNNIYFIHDAILLALHNHSLSHPTFHRRTMQVSQNDKHNKTKKGIACTTTTPSGSMSLTPYTNKYTTHSVTWTKTIIIKRLRLF